MDSIAKTVLDVLAFIFIVLAASAFAGIVVTVLLMLLFGTA